MRKKTILLADDDHYVLEALSVRCQALGLEVLTAHDALTALAEIAAVVPDVVCLDINMPAGNGLSVCEMMSGDERLSTIPVIMLTGRSDQDTIRRCHSLCAYYVPKGTETWSRVEPLLRELLAIDSNEIDEESKFELSRRQNETSLSAAADASSPAP